MWNRHRLEVHTRSPSFNPHAPSFSPSSLRRSAAEKVKSQKATRFQASVSQVVSFGENEWPSLPPSGPDKERKATPQHAQADPKVRTTTHLEMMPTHPHIFSGAVQGSEGEQVDRTQGLFGQMRVDHGGVHPHHQAPYFSSQMAQSKAIPNFETPKTPRGMYRYPPRARVALTREAMHSPRSVAHGQYHDFGHYPGPPQSTQPGLYPRARFGSLLTPQVAPSMPLQTSVPSYRPIFETPDRFNSSGYAGPGWTPGSTTPLSQRIHSSESSRHGAFTFRNPSPQRHFEVPSVPNQFHSGDTSFSPMLPKVRVDESQKNLTKHGSFNSPQLQHTMANGATHNQYHIVPNAPAAYSASPFRSTPGTTNRQNNNGRRRGERPKKFPRKQPPRSRRTDQGPMPSDADIYPDDSFEQVEGGFKGSLSIESPPTVHRVHGFNPATLGYEQAVVPFTPQNNPMANAPVAPVPSLMDANIPGYLRTPYPVPPTKGDLEAEPINDIQPSPCDETRANDSLVVTGGKSHIQMLAPAIAIHTGDPNSSAARQKGSSTLPSQRALMADQADGSRYGLNHGGLGLTTLGDSWKPPVLDGRFAAAKSLWEDRTEYVSPAPVDRQWQWQQQACA
ncbi:hypothetical protein BU24DRAFT_482320 [Aaosphaeria arxii CBS 175.79]|uniref:Uncharacterized protein n=1 Tax=Aaosphaeria arxii CBS 175.79 TaxID=1450172 RepID=A0A6A5XNQ1_9PLEO|nr:uncharacterized protein BU24DRAFT_482320 [Aaosphaeria arxii CBS 175.79]KAF2014772.1 hypothetical protein BU24DRAFT_482320 [Aaosphaeria arxii CBS 175.79]